MNACVFVVKIFARHYMAWEAVEKAPLLAVGIDGRKKIFTCCSVSHRLTPVAKFIVWSMK
jgi:hypothetical protein